MSISGRSSYLRVRGALQRQVWALALLLNVTHYSLEGLPKMYDTRTLVHYLMSKISYPLGPVIPSSAHYQEISLL